jgi:hypothetical protein
MPFSNVSSRYVAWSDVLENSGGIVEPPPRTQDLPNRSALAHGGQSLRQNL